MKFQLVIEATEKRLVLVPENQSEAVLLGTICDPNAPNMNSDLKDVSKGAVIIAKVSDDRIPYRKVTELHIIL